MYRLSPFSLEITRKLAENPNEQLIYQQPSVIAYGDASSLDAKTQFVASYAPRETASRANVALRRREHIKG